MHCLIPPDHTPPFCVPQKLALSMYLAIRAIWLQHGGGKLNEPNSVVLKLVSRKRTKYLPHFLGMWANIFSLSPSSQPCPWSVFLSALHLDSPKFPPIFEGYGPHFPTSKFVTMKLVHIYFPSRSPCPPHPTKVTDGNRAAFIAR